ncbi:hypothetical protein [Streptomyces sp. NPDC090994]|uniref:hypothetical protein n=1 Tax=Streptomyces sp. NPDC090994 TaxID=3365969 RepID=UPI00382A8307
MHETVVSGLDTKFEHSGKEGFTTDVPLRASSLTPSVLEEEIDGRRLTVKADGAGRTPTVTASRAIGRAVRSIHIVHPD